MHTRDVLDDAVRRLAVSDEDLETRLRSSARALGQLTLEDFSDPEDRQLLARVQRRIHQLSLAEAHEQGNGGTAAAEQRSTRTLEAIADEVLALRDITMGRALRLALREGQSQS